MKKIKVLIILTAYAIALCGALIFLNACTNVETPIYEIKLFTEKWEEIEKIIYEDGTYFYTLMHEFNYDGNPKAFNAIAYRNGEEFYKFDCNNEDDYENYIINLSINNYVAHSVSDLPVEKGEYKLLYSYYWRSVYGLPDVFAGEQFPPSAVLTHKILIKII